MKLLPTFSLLLVAGILSLLYASAFGNTISYSKLGQKYDELVKLSSKAPVIDADAEMFDKFAMKKPKNYTVVAMLTALGEAYRCHHCHIFYKHFELVAQSYKRVEAENPGLFFFLLDVDRGRSIFERLRLRTVPYLAEFKADKTQAGDEYDLRRLGLNPEPIATWIHRQTNIKIKVIFPVDYVKPTVAVLVLIVIGSLSVVFRKNLLTFLGSSFWSLVVLAIIYTFMSGQMWNKIRDPPMVHSSPTETTYIYQGQGMQFKAETFIVAALYAAFAAAMIAMNFAVEVKLRRRYKILMSFCGLAVVIVIYSLLLSIYRSKNRGYPYRCLFA